MAERRTGLLVLLAEDAPFLRLILVRILTAAGHCCVAVEDGLAALSAARSTRFDLIITDHAMPGLDGCSLVARLRAGAGPNRTTPALLLSGYAGDGALEAQAATAGVDAVVAKPIETAAVLHAVEVLARRPSRPSSLVRRHPAPAA